MTDSSTPMDSTLTEAMIEEPWAFDADNSDITLHGMPIFKVYREWDFPCIEDEERPAADMEYIAHAGVVCLLLNDIARRSSESADLAMRSASTCNSTVTEAVDPASDESAIVRVRLLALAGPLTENVCNDLLRVCDLAMRSASLPSGEVKSAREALSRYGRHETVCGLYIAMGRPCVCGWHEIRQALSKGEAMRSLPSGLRDWLESERIDPSTSPNVADPLLIENEWFAGYAAAIDATLEALSKWETLQAKEQDNKLNTKGNSIENT